MDKLDRFRQWLSAPHGRQVYGLFSKFAHHWRAAGHDRCGAALIGNRIRWEVSVENHGHYKIPNNYLPMLARQLACDDPTFSGFFTFHDGCGYDPDASNPTD